MAPNSPNVREDGLRELREIRLRRGLSQADLSAITGVAEFTISEIETGKRANPRPSTLRKLAQGLDVKVADLYGELDSPLGAAPSSQEKLFNNGVLDEERRLHYLRLFRTFLHAFAQHWEQEPPTFRETAPLNVALIDTLGQGALDPPWQVGPKEAIGLEMLSDGFQRLHEVAAKAKEEERAGEQTQAAPPDLPADWAEADEEQHLRYLRGWRDFIDGLAQRWEEKPPQTSEEIDPTLGGLAPLLDQRVFDLSGREGPPEAEELVRILGGIKRLVEIMQKVGQGDNIASMEEYRERSERSA
jgi:transcriptional regulator with XRE-family HTH domain